MSFLLSPFYPSLTSSEGGGKGRSSCSANISGSQQELQCQLPLKALAASDGAAVAHLSFTASQNSTWEK